MSISIRLSILSLIFIVILAPGCIFSNNNQNTIPDAKNIDLSLLINMDKTSCNLTNKQLNVNVTLSNIKGYSVKIQKSFQVGTWLKVEIISPNNERLEEELIQEVLKDEKIVIKANEKIDYIFSIFSINYLKENGENYHWEIGNYTIKFRYLFTEPDVISNELQFQIYE